ARDALGGASQAGRRAAIRFGDRSARGAVAPPPPARDHRRWRSGLVAVLLFFPLLFLAVFLAVLDRFLHRVLRVADVIERAATRGLGPAVILAALDVTRGFAEQLHRLA